MTTKPDAPLRGSISDTSSPAWPGEDPVISVVVSTYGRSSYLPGLLRALEAQTLRTDRFDVVIVDNGSDDDTWDQLVALIESGGLRLRVLRLPENRGPGGGRNAGIAASRAPLLAITDDDCIPSPAWLEGLLVAFDGGADVVQGPVHADAGGLAELGWWWNHTVNILGPSPWFETSNVAYRRSAVEAVGGFDEADSLTAQHGGGRAFGEDAVLGARVIARGGGRAWAADAVVYHRVVPSTYGHQLREWRNLRGFPGLVRRSPIGTETMYGKVFLNKETALFDLAVVGGVAALLTRQPAFLVATLPWVRRRWGVVRERSRSDAEAALRVMQRGVLEAVGLVSLAEGSVRHRRLVL
jgi:glycosyltransferase involved in cell wall biosynthesis